MPLRAVAAREVWLPAGVRLRTARYRRVAFTLQQRTEALRAADQLRMRRDALLRQAVARTPEKTLPRIASQLLQLDRERNQ